MPGKNPVPASRAGVIWRVHCLVTAGPTYEPIDSVRRLTNHSTGRLGCALADALARAGHRVTLLRSETALHRAKSTQVTTVPFTTTTDLRQRLRALAGKEIGAVFHVAAVSDFRVAKLCDVRKRPLAAAGKVSSAHSVLWAQLLPTPKLIGSLHRWFPLAIVVGWKYEVTGNRADSLQAGHTQLRTHRTQACVVNGPAHGEGFSLLTDSETVQAPTRLRLLRELLRLIGNRD